MLNWMRSGIGLKLAFVVSVGLTSSMFVLTNISTRLVQKFGELSASKNETNIRDQAYYFLSKNTQEQAVRYEVIFQQFSSLSRLIAYQAESYLDHLDLYSETNLNSQESLTLYPKKGIFSNQPSERVSVVYWDKPIISQAITAQINTLSHLDPLLEKAQKSNSSAVASWVLMESTVLRYYPNAPLINALPPKNEDDVRSGIFYTIAKPKNNPNRKTLWTKAYQDPAGQGLMTSVTTPIYNQSNQFLGVAGIDVTLNNIVKEILAVEQQNPQNELNGAFSFLIDQTGNIIAFPLEHLELFGIKLKSDNIKLNQLLDYSLAGSSNPKIREITKEMIGGKSQVEQIFLKEQPYIISFHSITSTGWSLGVVIPEASLLSSVKVTRQALNSTVQTLNSQLGLTSIVLLLGSVIIILLLTRQIVKPLSHLTQEVSQLQSSDQSSSLIAKLEQIHPENIHTTTKEIEELQKAFVQMKNSLLTNWKQLESRNKEMKALNAELQRLDQLKDEFLANTSHELRTPLNGIIGIAESLIDGVTGQLPPTTNSNLSMIVFSGRRLSNLVNDILDFSQLKHKTIELQLKDVGMRELVEIVLTLSQTLIGQKKIQLINTINPEIPPVNADENRVQQILHNLVGNAIKFTDSGTVEVSAQVVDEHLAITISDTGIGIPEDKFDRVFESFEQADGSTARQYGGTGLGLAVTKKLVELHGGKITIASKVGVGSQFTFTLPLYQGDAQLLPQIPILKDLDKVQVQALSSNTDLTNNDISSRDLSRDTPKPNNGKVDIPGEFKILIVDDEPINLQVLVNHLSTQNYALTQATSGQEALEIIKSGFKPDLILLDVMMPRMTGYEVTQQLRDRFPANDLPILLLTAKTQVSAIVQGLNIGANDYLAKPIAKDELLARIKTHLNLRQLRAENFRLNAELNVAKQLQEMVLPKQSELDAVEGLEIAAFMEPADEVGGDYYDVLQQNGKVKIGIGDVTGHGLESGVLMLMTQTAVRTLQESNHTDPVQFLDILNRTIYGNTQRINPYKNLTLALLDYADGILTLSGQHEEIIVVRSGGIIERIDTIDLGLPIGIENDISEFISTDQIQLNSGDAVILYTDGITEAFDLNREQYGIERLCQVVSHNWEHSAKEIKQAVIEDVRRHIGTQKVFDDITLVVLKQK